MNMETYFDSLCETLDCDVYAFNMPLHERIRIMSLERGTPASYIVSGSDLTNMHTEFSDCNIIVLPMFGMNASAIGDVDSECNADIKPRPDGARVSCLMLADDTVALTSIAPHWADTGYDDEFHILWLFDDEALLSSHHINDDLSDELQVANAIAEDHDPLTQEEVQAWQARAAEADYIGIFDCISLCEK
ncbi:hypothetical protein [Paraburkholderia caribensis]|uniref:hypothetical protein n=1 Tax=Paraburkholderia caribensis TaxID=75105 RepID=UPI0012E8A6E7|nr:hypothetical protein [Paraburkholderia caribensis]